MADFYPPVGFHFFVSFTGLGDFASDVMFQSVSGLDVQLETESIKEGGENRFEHVVPNRTKYSDLVLKRGMLTPADSGVTQWCQDAFQRLEIQPIDLKVDLLDENHDTLLSWNVVHAWPKNWKVGEMNAEKGEILIETLELHYNRYVLN